MTPEADVPAGWTRERLGDLVESAGEIVQPGANDNQPYVALEHIAQGFPRLLGCAAASEATSAKTAFKTGDILFGKLRPNLRKSAEAPFDGVCSTDILALRAEARLDRRFLLHLTHSPAFQEFAVSTSSGTRMPRTSWGLLRDFTVSLPPLPEQRKIAAILSSIDNAVERSRAVVEQLRVTRRAFLDRLMAAGRDFGDTPQGPTRADPQRVQPVPLGDLLEGIEAGWSPACDTVPAASGEWGVLKVSSITWDEFRPWENKRLPADLTPRPEIEVRPGDVLLSRANTPELVGRAGFVETTTPRLMLSDKLLRLRPNGRVVAPRYLALALELPRSRTQIREAATGSSQSMKNISQEALRRVRVPLLSPKGQFQVVSVAESFGTRLVAEVGFADALLHLRSALSAVLLSGETRVTPDEAVA